MCGFFSLLIIGTRGFPAKNIAIYKGSYTESLSSDITISVATTIQGGSETSGTASLADATPNLTVFNIATNYKVLISTGSTDVVTIDNVDFHGDPQSSDGSTIVDTGRFITSYYESGETDVYGSERVQGSAIDMGAEETTVP